MAELLKFYQSKPNLKFLKKAADTLEQGGLIIYPTDTVYALGCLSNNRWPATFGQHQKNQIR